MVANPFRLSGFEPRGKPGPTDASGINVLARWPWDQAHARLRTIGASPIHCKQLDLSL